VASHPTTYGATAPTERTVLHATAPLRITFLATAPTITMADEAAAAAAAAAPVTLWFSLKVMTGGILLDLVQEMVACWPVERVIAHLQLWQSWWRVWRRLVKWIQIINTIYYHYCEVTVLFIYYYYLADISIYWLCGGVTNINAKYNSSQACTWGSPDWHKGKTKVGPLSELGKFPYQYGSVRAAARFGPRHTAAHLTYCDSTCNLK
jgi:hypothetical protein